MPTYEIRDNRTGRTIEITADREPTQEEMNEIFSQVSPVSQQVAQPAEQADEEMSGLARVAADVGIEAGGAIAGTAIGAALAPATFGASIPIGALVGGIIGGTAGNVIVQRGQIQRGERPDFSYGELAASVGLSAIPGSTFAKTGSSVVKNMGLRAAQGAGLAGASEVAKTVIDEHRLPTPDEFLKATVFGAATGGLLGGAEKAVTGAIAKTPEAQLGKLAGYMKRISGEQAALSVDGDIAINELQRGLSNIKDKVQRDTIGERAMMALGGEIAPTDLPPEIGSAVDKIKTAIAELGIYHGESGLVDKDSLLYQAILDNLGSYNRRSYRVFETDYTPSEKIFNDFVNTKVEKEIAEKVRERQVSSSIAGTSFDANSYAEQLRRETGADLRQKYINRANELLDRGEAERFLTGQSVRVSKDPFRRRKDIDDETRALLGEIRDPVFVASNTLGMMTRSQATYNVLSEMRDIGLSEGLFRVNSVRGDVPISKDTSSFNPFKDPNTGQPLYTTPEIRDALASVNSGMVSKLAQHMAPVAAASGFLKAFKTLGSMKAYATNVIGGTLEPLAQGHVSELFNTGNWGRAAKLTGYNLGVVRPDGSVDGKEMKELYKFFLREGLQPDNTSYADFLRTWELGEKSIPKALQGNIVSGFKTVTKKLGKIYSTPDNMAKVFIFEGELRKLREAYPDQSINVLMKRAADETKMVSSNYNALPKFIKDASSIGFLDPFVAYTADRFRVVYNTYRLGMQELASGNPALMKAGAKRLVSMSSVIGSASYLGANTHLTQEEEKALRNRMPDWDKNSLVAISKPSADGTFKYQNLNYLLPHAASIEAMQAAMRGQNPEEAFTNLMKSVSSQALGLNLLLEPLAEVTTGKNRYGLPISSENAPLYKQAFARSSLFLGETVTPLAVREMNKFFKVLESKDRKVTTSSGDVYGVGDLLKENFMGVREKTVNLRNRMRVGASILSRDHTSDSISYSSARKNALTEKDAQDAYRTFEERYKNTYRRASELVADGRALGMTDDDLVKLMKTDGGVPSSIVLAAISGVYTPPATEDTNPVRAIYERIEAIPESQRTAAVERAARENPTLARAITSRYRAELRAKALNISAVDKLILAQDEADGDRARFIFQKLQTLPDDLVRTAYLEDLRKKRIITPVVNAQLNLLMNPPR